MESVIVAVGILCMLGIILICIPVVLVQIIGGILVIGALVLATVVLS